MSRPAALVGDYYAALDEHACDDQAGLLAPEFVHYRPDRTIEGRETFVAVMRDVRPMTDTTHAIDRVFPDGDGAAVQGRLLDGDGEELFRFADVHTIDEETGRIAQVRTYTQGHPRSVEATD